MEPVLNPTTPYLGEIRGGPFAPGRMVRIQGSVPAIADRFDINLQCGPNNFQDDIALHIAVHLTERVIVRNSLLYQNWGQPEEHGDMPIGCGLQFEVLILCDYNDYKIAINGQHYCEFKHRTPHNRVNHLRIQGDVMVSLINYESGFPPQQQQPPAGMAQPPPYQQQPGAPGAYGFPPGGPEAPRSPGHGQKSSGGDFGSFLSQAGAAVAGALATGGIMNSLSNMKKLKKQNKKALKYGVPLVGAGLGTYALAKGLKKFGRRSSSSSSSSSSSD